MRIGFNEGFVWDDMSSYESAIDLARVAIQILSVSILCAGLAFLFKDKQ